MSDFCPDYYIEPNDENIFDVLDAIEASTQPQNPELSAFDELGPFYAKEDIAQSLGLTEDELSRMAADFELLELPLEDGSIVYPIWEFDGKTIQPWLKELLPILVPACASTWTVATWLHMTKFFPPLDGKSISQWVAEGNDLSEITAAAKHDAARWAQ